ncbi:MAG: trigger factor [Thermoleophilia bacterium]
MPVSAAITTLDDDRAQLDVTVPGDEVEEAFGRTLSQMAKDVRIPGFRPGKVPPHIVVQRYGRETVLNETLKSSIGDWYDRAVEVSGIRPIDEPDLDLTEVPEQGEDLVFRATVRTRPKATLGAYKGLEVGKGEVEVPEGIVEQELERLQLRASRLEPVERPAKSGDFIVIDFDGSIGGKRMKSASARDYLVELGAQRLMAGFDEKLEGLSAGETATHEVTYADDDNRPELRGRTMEYTVTIKQVQERVLPELDDDLAAEVSEFDTIDELKADILDRATKAAQAQVDEMFRRRVIDAVVENATVDVPEVMVLRRINTILNQTAQSLPQGVSFEAYLSATGRTLDQAVDQLRPDAEMAVKRELVVEAVIEADGVEVSDEDVETQVREDAERMGRDADQLLAEVRKEGAFERLREDMRLQRAVEALVESAVPVALVEEEQEQEQPAEADAPAADSGEESGEGESNPSTPEDSKD